MSDMSETERQMEEWRSRGRTKRKRIGCVAGDFRKGLHKDDKGIGISERR